MAQSRHPNATDNNISGMGGDWQESDSSSSEDELPDFMKPKPLNIVYPDNPNVMIIDSKGKVIKKVPHDEFKRINQDAKDSDPSKGTAPIHYYQPNEQNFYSTESNNEDIPGSAPAISGEPNNREGEFSIKYKEKIEKQKNEAKQKEQTMSFEEDESHDNQIESIT